jgi:hypothetical protein
MTLRKGRIREAERGSTLSHSVENSLWKRLSTRPSLFVGVMFQDQSTKTGSANNLPPARTMFYYFFWYFLFFANASWCVLVIFPVSSLNTMRYESKTRSSCRSILTLQSTERSERFIFYPSGDPANLRNREERKREDYICGLHPTLGINTNYTASIQLSTLTDCLVFCTTKTEVVTSFGKKGWKHKFAHIDAPWRQFNLHHLIHI